MKYYSGILRQDGTRTDPRFPIELWNLHERTVNGQHRTNNVAEASHRRLQGLFSCSHPSLWKFIEILWKEQKARDADYALFVTGHKPPQKLKKYRDADAQILKIFENFDDNNLNIEDFLIGIARIWKMTD
jgi:hypothetical protein